jgi:hypothetical protein
MNFARMSAGRALSSASTLGLSVSTRHATSHYRISAMKPGASTLHILPSSIRRGKKQAL